MKVRAILNCCGWQDLELVHGFHRNERGQTRNTVLPEPRRVILWHLLALCLRLSAVEAGRVSTAPAAPQPCKRASCNGRAMPLPKNKPEQVLDRSCRPMQNGNEKRTSFWPSADVRNSESRMSSARMVFCRKRAWGRAF
jgi:hypothetical protein